jgi:hypothetical protein
MFLLLSIPNWESFSSAGALSVHGNFGLNCKRTQIGNICISRGAHFSAMMCACRQRDPANA